MKLIDRKHGLGITTELSKLEIGDKPGRESSVIKSPPDVSVIDDNGIHITIYPNREASAPIIIKKRTSGNAATKIDITAGENSKATIILEHVHLDSSTYSEEDTKIYLSKNSELHVASITQTNSNVTMARRTARLEKDSKLHLVTFDKDAKLSIAENVLFLEGEGAKAKTLTLYHGEKGQEYEDTTIAVHEARNTESLLLSKGMLNEAKSTSKGLIRIQENAYDSNAYQKSDTLLIGDARSISIPDLEIHNDKVKCTHGSTTTHMDEEKIFYLQSRGLSRHESEKLMIKAFYDTALGEVDDAVIRINIQQHIEKKIGVDDGHE